MARYFFNIIDGRFLADGEGVECTSLTDAREQALMTAGEIIREAGDQLWDSSEWQMLVTDEAHRTVLHLRFSAEQIGA